MAMQDRLIVVATVVVIGFGIGWKANGWRLESSMERLRAADATALRVAGEASARELARVTAERDAKAATLSTIAAEGQAAQTKDRNELEKLRAAVAAGSVRLRVAAACPARAADLPASAPGRSVDSGAGAVLTAEAGQDYFSLIDGIARTQRKLTACQRSLGAITGQTAPLVSPTP